MRLCRPHCPPALGVPLALLAAALVGPADASAAFHRDRTPLPKSITGSTGSASSSGGGGGGGAAFARMLVGLVIVIGVILAVYWLLKTYGRSKGGLREDGRIEVLATTTLAPSRAVHLLRVGNELVLVGSAEGGVTPIRIYDAAEARRLDLEGLEDAPAAGVTPKRRGSALEQLRKITAR